MLLRLDGGDKLAEGQVSYLLRSSSHQQILTTCVMTSIDRVYDTDTPWKHTDGVVFKTDDKLITDGRSSQYTSMNSERILRFLPVVGAHLTF